MQLDSASSRPNIWQMIHSGVDRALATREQGTLASVLAGASEGGQAMRNMLMTGGDSHIDPMRP